jgi:hypothetical protein
MSSKIRCFEDGSVQVFNTITSLSIPAKDMREFVALYTKLFGGGSLVGAVVDSCTSPRGSAASSVSASASASVKARLANELDAVLLRYESLNMFRLCNKALVDEIRRFLDGKLREKK